VNHTAPVQRRIRAVLDGRIVVDMTSALYVWEWSDCPQYYIPVDDIDPAVLVDEQHGQKLSRGTARRHALQVGEIARAAGAADLRRRCHTRGTGRPGQASVRSPLAVSFRRSRAWLTMTPRYQFMSLAAHFRADRVGHATHSCRASFEERR
jgi:Domain of unknown function (DUF427)